jgi:RHS repeat-associated protein
VSLYHLPQCPSAASGGQSETESGVLIHQPDRRDHLALGHTIVRTVDLFDGQFVLSRSDAALAGRGPGLRMARTYASAGGNRASPYGRGWNTLLDARLQRDACGVVQAIGGDGGGARFVYDYDDPDGFVVYRALDGYHSTLIRRSTGDWDLYALDGTRYAYGGSEDRLQFVEDTSGNRVSYRYATVAGRRVVVALEEDSGRSLQMRYEEAGLSDVGRMPLLVQLTGPGGIDVRYEYDNHGNLIQTTRAGSGSADAVESFAYHDFGIVPDPPNPLRSHTIGWRMSQVTNTVSGAQIDYAYVPDVDWTGEGTQMQAVPVYRVATLTETEAGTVSFGYSGNRGQPQPVSATVENARGFTTSYTMNRYGGVEMATDPIGSNSTVWNLTHRKPASTTDAEGVTTTYSHDAFGNTLLERISGNGDTIEASWTYHSPTAFDPPYIKNRPATATDFRGIVSSFDYDSAGRLTSHSKGGVSMSYGYDARGDVISDTDWNGNTSTFHYNAHGLRIRSTWPDGAVQSAVFDERGRQTLATDERGNSTATTYDGFDRPLSIDPPGNGQRSIAYDDATPARTETDELDRSTSYILDKQGRLVEIINALADSRSLTLDEHGNVLTESDFRGNTRTATFDALDCRITLAEPEGRNTNYSYLKTGQLVETTVTGAGGTRVMGYRYQHPRYFRTGEFGVLDGEEVGSTDTIDGEGNVLTRTDALGRVSTWTYDAFGRPLTLSEPEGRSTTYSYDAQGNLLSESVSGVGGTRMRGFAYDQRHRQTTRIDRNGERWTVGYDAKGNRISETDPLGRVSQYEYDERDRMFRQTLPGMGRVTSYGYDAVDNRTSETHPSGQQITHEYDDLNRLTSSADQLGPIETRDYDPDGNLLTRTDGRALTTTATYDELGRKLTESQPENRNWSWTWNAWDQPLSETNPRNLTTTHEYDELGRRTRSTDPIGTQSWEFDVIGNLRSQTDRLNRTTEFDIDGLNRRTNQLDPTGHTQVWVHNAFDDLIEHTDRRGIVSTWAHDFEGRITAHNRTNQTRMQYGHDAAGQQTSRTDALNRVTRIDFDPAGRIIAERLPESAVITRTWHPSDDPASETDPDGLTISFEYDERRRLVAEINALNETTLHDYDGNGNRTQSTRPLQSQWIFEYDQANRLTAVTDGETHRTEYTYDRNGNRESILDASGDTRTFEFDDLDRQTVQRWADGSIETITRDAEGNPEATLRPNGQTISRDFDGLNRLILETFEPVTEDGIASIEYTYNGNGQITQVTETLSGATCPQGGSVCSASFDYDELDRLTAVTDRNRQALTQRYDPADNRIARTGPEGETGYTFNGLDQIVAVTPPGRGAIGLAPTPAGRWGEITHGNGIRTEVTHDPAGRMNGVRHWLGAAAVLLSTYSFDANGNRVSETIEAQSQSWLTSYAYDDADRLTGYTSPEGQTTYTLDPVGNRIQTTKDGVVSTADFDNRDRLIAIRDGAGVVQTSYTYDAAGRQTSQTDHKLGTQTHYSYSATDRLIAIRQGSPTAEPIVRYEYHRLTRGSPTGGQRSARVDASSREHYQWDGLKLSVRTNSIGNPLAHYTAANGWTLASVESGTEYSHHTDALGTPLLLTDPQAGLVVRYRYDPWGVQLEQTKPHPNPIGFTGYLRDTATDQLYAQARQYQPGAGRFTSVDPWTGDPLVPVSLNQYLYGYGNPGTYIDPNGEESVTTMIDEAAEGCNLVTCAGYALLQGVYQVGTLGFASVHDPVRDAYDDGKISGGEYIGKGIVGGGAVAGLNIVTGRVGGTLVAGATGFGSRLATGAAVGAVGGGLDDIATQSVHMSAGVQESYDVDRTIGAVSVGAFIGSGSAVGGDMYSRWRAHRASQQARPAIVTEGSDSHLAARIDDGFNDADVAYELEAVSRPAGRGGIDVRHSTQIDVPFGQGVGNQGFAYEDALAAGMPTENRLPPNFKTFDFFDDAQRQAISAKTLDTTTPSRLGYPQRVYSSLRSNINAAAKFREYQLGSTMISSADVGSRVVRVAVPMETTAEQWTEIMRAIRYAEQQGVQLVPEVVTNSAR